MRFDAAETWQAYIWLFDVTPTGKTAYVSSSASPHSSDKTSLYEFNLEDGQTRFLCKVRDLDPALQHRHIHTGYNAWDGSGRFYFASFNGQPDQPVILTRIDPDRLQAALAKQHSVSR